MSLRDGLRPTSHRRNPGIGLVVISAIIALVSNIITLTLLLFVYLAFHVEGRHLQVLSSRFFAFTEQGASLLGQLALLAGIVSFAGTVIGGALLVAAVTWLTHQGFSPPQAAGIRPGR